MLVLLPPGSDESCPDFIAALDTWKCMMRTVLTLHGVGVFGGRGPWQKSVQKVIAPHFRCIPIKYSHYRWLGFLSAVVEPRLFILGLGVILLLRKWYAIHFLWAWIIAIFALSCSAARIRHGLALSYFLAQSSKQLPLGHKPHVIAHSMGTKLVGMAIEEYPQVRLENVVLAGCVLATNYPWRAVQRVNPNAFVRVRNDVGRRDLVPWLAHKGHQLRLLRGFGLAGRVGFDQVAGLVHTVRSPNALCASCTGAKDFAPIHNVINDKFTHSSVFATPEFASYFWLPFLWNIDPPEYSAFLDLCLAANEHFDNEDWVLLRATEEELLHAEWRWTRDVALEAHIGLYVAAHPGRYRTTTPVVAQVLRKVWQDFAAACYAYHDRRAGWQRQVAALNPTVAIVGAVDTILG
jgi:pimeloyl-ACP methyl ester carboxylesterase